MWHIVYINNFSVGHKNHRGVFQMKKNRFFVLGMLALALLFGVIFTGCESPSGGDNGSNMDGSNPLAGTEWSRNAKPDVHLIFDEDTFRLTNEWTDVGIHPYTVSGNTMTYFRNEIKVTLDFSINETQLIFSNASPPANLPDYSPFTLIQ
jgi:hypothetical protein